MSLLLCMLCGGEAFLSWQSRSLDSACPGFLPCEQLSKFRSPRRTLNATASPLWRLSASNSSTHSRSSVSCLQRIWPSSKRRDEVGLDQSRDLPCTWVLICKPPRHFLGCLGQRTLVCRDKHIDEVRGPIAFKGEKRGYPHSKPSSRAHQRVHANVCNEGIPRCSARPGCLAAPATPPTVPGLFCSPG